MKFLLFVTALTRLLSVACSEEDITFTDKCECGFCWGQQLELAQRLGFDPLAANFTGCPGYTLHSRQNTPNGLIAELAIAGPSCNTFGLDIPLLVINVTYETQARLHVHIFDRDKKQFQIPETVIARPSAPNSPNPRNSDLVFNYESYPFAFWITRRSAPHSIPLFDTRISQTGRGPVENGTSPLIFQDRYLQLASSLPLDTNIYGLSEVLSSSGFRRSTGAHGTSGTIQTLWARDAADPVDENIYGSHPVYIEHRYDSATKSSSTHGVFLMSSAGADIILSTPAGSNESYIQYRMLGGTLDFYFFAGPTPMATIEQYGELVGLPAWQPAWAFGFQLCRWGYKDIDETRQQVANMRQAGIPLEVMWNDIELYHAVRDFTTDPYSFPASEMKTFIEELHASHQYYVPIVDAAIAVAVNSTDIYDPYTRGSELDVFIKNPDGTEYVGQVWPGYTVFPDWFANNTRRWWTESLKNWSDQGLIFDGIWLDMNEASSFCEGSCGTKADLSNTTAPFFLPGSPNNPITDYPECYDSNVFGPSGNVTVNGKSTYSCYGANFSIPDSPAVDAMTHEFTVEATAAPAYEIHNGFGPLSAKTVAINATHSGNIFELDAHNLFGLMEEIDTYEALKNIHHGKRPFIVSRSTFSSSGKWSGHWLGDNFSKWSYMKYAIQGILQFQLFQIPFVGPDTCGFNGNADEELCSRWMQLSALASPFFRNHNIRGAIPQEPYRWDSVADASKCAIAIRYSMLPYWYTLFANASIYGTPPIRALFFEFPNEANLFHVDTQLLVGSSILVTPVLTPNATAVSGIFPGDDTVVWRDWYTHEVVNGSTVTLPSPLGHINVHIRDNAAILLHGEPAYTIEETRQGPFDLLVSLSKSGQAFGTVYLDDGVSMTPTPNRTLTMVADQRSLTIDSRGDFHVPQKLRHITILGIESRPNAVSIRNRNISEWTYTSTIRRLVIHNVGGDLNTPVHLNWSERGYVRSDDIERGFIRLFLDSLGRTICSVHSWNAFGLCA